LLQVCPAAKSIFPGDMLPRNTDYPINNVITHRLIEIEGMLKQQI
jgi:hypothetical protein